MKAKYILGAALVAIGTAILVSSRRTIPKNAKAIKPFDKEKYLGKWYEIARFDYRFEKNMDNVTASYALKDDGTIKVDNKGYDYEKKQWKESVGKAKAAGDPEEAKLKVSFFGPFYAGYNVLAIDKDYKYALVAGKSLDYLWLLSREKTMPEAIRQDYLKKAREIGYETEELVWTKQDKS